MKNFRKVLALILVVATLFSFVAMASAKSATEYTDYADVKNVEAVDVLTALGIINGYDGAFHPADTIDRDEMAKMIAVLRNAGDFDASLYASANKFADVKGQWAEGYVAYCAQLGIIAGQNATTFAPDDAVKTVDVAKMLLCVLGFDAQKQGYVGPNYQVAVMRDAAKFGIIPAGVDPYAPATRDTAAQMFLNALKAPLVIGYVGEGIVKATNSLFVDLGWPLGTGEWVDVSLYEVEKAGWEILSGTNAVVSYTPLYEIFGKGILTTTNVVDCFGRPAVRWTITDAYGVAILDKTYAAPAAYTYTTKVDLATELTGLYGKLASVPAAATVYVNGSTAGVAQTLANASALTGKGVKTEVYVDGTSIRVVIINTYIAKVTAITKIPATVTLSNGYTFKNTLGLTVGDYVMFNECAGAAAGHGAALSVNNGAKYIHDIWEVAPTVETVIHTSWAWNNTNIDDYAAMLDESYFQTAAKKFEYSANFERYLAGNGILHAPISVKDGENVYDVFVDQYGYVMWYEVHQDEVDLKYAYVVENTQNAGAETLVDGVWTRDYSFDMVNYDGTAGTKAVAADQATYADEVTYTMRWNTANKQGALVEYVLDSKGKVDFARWATFAGADAKVVKDVAKIYGTNVSATTATEYMVRTYNFATGDFSYDVYVGYNNLPDTLFGYKNVGDGATKIRTLQYLTDADHADTATHVFIDAVYAGAAEQFYLLSMTSLDAETALYPFLKGYTVYTALVDGEKAAVAISSTEGTWDLTNNSTAIYGLYKASMKVIDGVTINGLPIYMAIGAIAAETFEVQAAPVNGLISVDYVKNCIAETAHTDVQIAAGAEIHVIYPVDGVMTYSTFKGETRDADFDAMYQITDWNTMSVYANWAKVGQYGETVNEITELWIKLG